MKTELQFGCIGKTLGHSFSEQIHALLGDYEYRLCELTAEQLAPFMATRSFIGINVTVPYKQAVMSYLDEIDGIAKEIGSVNTVINRNGKLIGYNTDFDGLKALIEREKVNVAGKKVLILGSGGTSKTASAVAKHLGASRIVRVSRTGRDGCVTYETAGKEYADSEVLINTTPCGMFPDVDNAPIDLDVYPSLKNVVDVVYNPLRTELVLQAQKRGIPAVGGLYMLVAQAVYASELFLNRKYDKSVAEKVYQTVLSEKMNIVLIGMPSSGKTTTGERLAEMLSVPFTDIDKEIEKAQKKSVSDIFSEQGETAFRRFESETIMKICAEKHGVIATGGGSILDEKNVAALKRNGTLIFLDRPFERLQSTSDRPTASTREDLKKLYDTRLPIYRACADFMVTTEDGVEKTAGKIAKLWGETV